MNIDISSIRTFLKKTGVALSTGLCSLAVVHSVSAAPSQLPLFLVNSVKPIVMLNMSNDHQLFFKAYDDYSDITGDGIPDTSYVHSHDYYGYFDSFKCYTYTSGRFEPAVAAAGKYCGGTGQWSGNFLNWATMTRIDTVRKILYGGYRQVDTATETVLERAMLPNDAHSFAKYYNGTDIHLLTPFPASDAPSGLTNTAATGITICNTTDPSTRNVMSQNVNSPPLMRVAKGNYSLWASNERWQCRWDTQSNGNDSAVTGIYAYGSSPQKSSAALGNGDYNVRVKVCVSPPGADSQSNLNEGNCEAYGNNAKPRGLLQEFGRDDSMMFGLMTGSYGRNKSGGVLRKNAGLISDEINEDGTFKASMSEGGIIQTLNALRIYGYNFNDGIYNNGDSCPWALSSFNDGSCSNWGNPQSEIYLESLRYLAGLSPTSAFVPSSSDGNRVSGLVEATWQRPVTQENYCAPLSVIQFNASTVSYDSDSLDGSTELNIDRVKATDYVGEQENLTGQYFVGEATGQTDQLCTPKTVTQLSAVRGTCPDAPRLQGSYLIAGLAHHARREGIPVSGLAASVSQRQVVTYGVSLVPAIPRITVPVPASASNTDNNATKSITILPACRNNLTNANCAIVDFKVFEMESVEENGVQVNKGLLYVNWEDSEQGGDFDQDMWGVIRFAVTPLTVTITTQIMAQSTGDPMGFGYIISGTSDDNFHVHSGVNNFTYPDANNTGSCRTNNDSYRCTCRVSGTEGPCNSPHAGARTKVFNIGQSEAQFLREPLYYAAKWGGYSKGEEEAAIAKGTSMDELVEKRDVESSYFYATDPHELESSLNRLFLSASARDGVAASAATNSTRLIDGVRLYQAMFNSTDWSGTLKAWSINPETRQVSADPVATTDTYFKPSGDVSIDSGRTILTNTKGSTTLVNFAWDNLSPWQQGQLTEGEDASAQALAARRVDWIRGNRYGEGTVFRKRENSLLGDIVNSSPVYAGASTLRYTQLPGTPGASYANYAKSKPKVLYVGANDGMLHAFDADSFEEIFAYIPNGVYPKLANVTKLDYGSVTNPHLSLVDGPLYVGDAYLASRGGWSTILVGSLGAGGKGVFALDVTNPNSPQLIFEIDAEDYPSLGYVLGQPLITPLANGRWAVVFGNGYESGTSRLFMIDLESPGSPTIIDTGAGTGLSAPSLMIDFYGRATHAFAGDLLGNIWKFDLSSSSVAYNGPLFVARDANGNAQPITGGLTLGANEQLNAIMVYFGTGKYFEAGDNFVTASPVHSFYAIADLPPSTHQHTRNNMHRKTLANVNGNRVVNGERTTGQDPQSLMDWTVNKGWYLDFSLINGERVIIKPVLIMDRLIFNTIIPSPIPCEAGGRSFSMELVAVGDRNIGHNVLDNINVELDELTPGDPTIITDDKRGVKVDTSVTGKHETSGITLWDSYRGRMSWRDFR